MSSTFEQNAVYLQSGDPTKEDAASLMEPGTLGARFTLQHPTGRGTPATPPRAKRFQLVRIDPATSAAPKSGQPVYWTDRANYLVGTAGGTGLNLVAGIVNNAPAKGNYTCIQFGGPCLVRAADGDVSGAAVGDLMLPGATDLAVKLATGGTFTAIMPLGTVAGPTKVTDVTGGTGNQKVLVDLALPDVV